MELNIRPLVALCSLPFLISCGDQEVEEEQEKTEIQEPGNSVVLREIADFKVGAAVNTRSIEATAKYEQVLSEHFSQITAEYEMKMNSLWTSPSSFDWGKADFLVKYVEENNMEVHGHTLLWYKNFPEWFKEADMDSVAFEKKVEHYITEVVSRYRGRVRSWDVVNEVFADGGGLREEEVIKPVFNDPIGFYGRCFSYARAADPNALLFYNDYNVVLDSGKRKAIKNMLDRFEKEGYPIDGIGDQFHYMQSTNKNQIRSGFEDMVSTGLLLHISELDIRMNINKSDSYVFSEEENSKQAATYKYIVELYDAIPNTQKFAITTWGISDKESWLKDWWHEKEYPLLFDENYNPKKAYQGFLDGLN